MIIDNGDLADYSTLEPRIPDSWVDEQGVRHAIVWDTGIQTRYKWVDGKLELLEVF